MSIGKPCAAQMVWRVSFPVSLKDFMGVYLDYSITLL